MASFLALSVSTERCQHSCGSSSPSRPLAARSSTVTGITNPPPGAACTRCLGLAPSQHIVGQDRFLNVSACAEKPAGRQERLGDLGDDSWRTEDRELRAERREQVAAMALSPVIGMDGDPVDEGARRPLGANQDADRIGAGEGDHAAAAPDLQVADRALERGRRHRRLARESTATQQRFSASTSSATSSVRQNRYALMHRRRASRPLERTSLR